jgi:hypothetical protein
MDWPCLYCWKPSGLEDLSYRILKKLTQGAKEGRTYFPVQRLKIRAALVPPNPKEFESA